MVSSILCCYRGCDRDVWVPRRERLVVAASSATCTSCRRVALCAPHFQSVWESGDLEEVACPHCGGRRWHVVLFEPELLPEGLRRAVEAAGGRVEVRTFQGQARPIAPPPEWRLGPVSPSVRARKLGASTEVLLPTGEPTLVDGVVGQVASAGAYTLLELHRPGRPTSLCWLTTGGGRGSLPNPHELACQAPVALDQSRFAYLAESPEQRWELREARFEGRRLFSRRVRGVAPVGPLVAVDRGLGAVLFQVEEELAAPYWLRLFDGRQKKLGRARLKPKALVGARDVPMAAWVTAQGEVRCGGPHQSEVLLGLTEGDALAISGDGRRVAWLSEDALMVAEVETGKVCPWHLPERPQGLSWVAQSL